MHNEVRKIECLLVISYSPTSQKGENIVLKRDKDIKHISSTKKNIELDVGFPAADEMNICFKFCSTPFL